LPMFLRALHSWADQGAAPAAEHRGVRSRRRRAHPPRPLRRLAQAANTREVISHADITRLRPARRGVCVRYGRTCVVAGEVRGRRWGCSPAQRLPGYCSRVGRFRVGAVSV
jgi:hypothetical protein